MSFDRSAIMLATLFLTACGAKAPPPTDPVVTGPQKATPEEICGGVTQRAEAVWSPEVRAELDLQVRVYEDSLDASDAERGVAWMEVLTNAWIRAGDATCKDHILARAIPIEAFYDRFECLGRVLQGQREAVALLKTAGEQASVRIEALVAELERCVPVDAGKPDIRENPF